ncbi:MAG: M56 family metallopeptidase [Clostridia bacterium]|nr:M56 family metallopeptidase [Clostridia bacterium]
MSKIFLAVLNMSLTASYVIVFVIAARMLLKKAPKIFSYALWGIVFFRLICPFSFESVLSLIPINVEPVPVDIGYQQNPAINSGIATVDNFVNSSLPVPAMGASVNPMQIVMSLLAVIWLMGIAVMLICSIYSVIKLTRNLKAAGNLFDNIYEAGNLKTPFILGILNPKIYLPTGLSADEKRYIIKHEQIHLQRFDHIVKPLAFVVLSIHWFNPLVWIAFLLMGTDMELSCDESVLKHMGSGIKKEYSASLLSLAAGKRIHNGCPLAFGESNAKSRIKNVLNYRKPAFWVVLAAVVAVLAICIGLMTNPKNNSIPKNMSISNRQNMQSADSSEQLSKDLEQSISTAILTYYAGDSYHPRCETVGEGHVILEAEEKNGLTYAYIWEKYICFGFKNGILTGIAGHANPATIVFQKDSQGNYVLKDFIRPLDGSGYLASLKKMFSPSAFEKYESADHGKNRAAMEAQIEAYGKTYLREIAREAEVQITLKDRQLIKMNTDVSNYLIDAYGEYPYWIGTREIVEDGIRYVYEKLWQDKGNQNGIVTFTKSIYEGDIVEKTVIEITGDKMKCLEGTLREEHYSKYN